MAHPCFWGGAPLFRARAGAPSPNPEYLTELPGSGKLHATVPGFDPPASRCPRWCKPDCPGHRQSPPIKLSEKPESGGPKTAPAALHLRIPVYPPPLTNQKVFSRIPPPVVHWYIWRK